MEFSYSQTENFEMEKLSSDTGYFKKPVEINRRLGSTIRFLDCSMINVGRSLGEYFEIDSKKEVTLGKFSQWNCDFGKTANN